MSPFYAVRHGRCPGIYHSWQECQNQVHQVSGSIFKKFRTRSAAEEFLNPLALGADSIVDGEFHVYTDGSCPGNGVLSAALPCAGWGLYIEGPRGWSADFYDSVVLDADHTHFLGATCCTNNTGELTAIGMACKWLLHTCDTRVPARILYDSFYAASASQGTFKRTRANIALAARVQDLLSQVRATREVHFEHVHGHGGNKGNWRADQNAARGAAGHSLYW